MDRDYTVSRRVQLVINVLALLSIAGTGFCYIPLGVLSSGDPMLALLALPAPLWIAIIYTVVSLVRRSGRLESATTLPGIILTVAGMVPAFIVMIIVSIPYWNGFGPDFAVRFA